MCFIANKRSNGTILALYCFMIVYLVHSCHGHGYRYEHIQRACVNGHNIVQYRHMTVDRCQKKCDERSDCLAFEFGVAYGGNGNYGPGDCQLQDGANPDGCHGSHHNLDLYIKKERLPVNKPEKKRLCSNGDAMLEEDGTPFIFWDNQWMPICGHYFWDNQDGAKHFCRKMGYSSGSFSGRRSGEKYDMDSFRIGKCKSGDKWESCSGGCNDYQGGGACSNNGGAKCDKDQAVKITIECSGGDGIKTTSCREQERKILEPICQREEGFCIKSNGRDQNSGVQKLNGLDGNTEIRQEQCLELCRSVSGATGCEVIWNQGNRGCYAHTREIARGNGERNHACWVFSKCATPGTTTTPPTTQAPPPAPKNVNLNEEKPCPPLSQKLGRCGPSWGGRCNKNLADYAVYCNEDHGWCGDTSSHKSAQYSDIYDWEPKSCQAAPVQPTIPPTTPPPPQPAPKREIEFRLTPKKYSETDIAGKCKKAFGAGWSIADWNDLKTQASEELLDSLSIPISRNDRYYFVTRDGGEWAGRPRHYFVERHNQRAGEWNTPAPSNWAVHDQTGHNLLTLGSWYGIRGQAICSGPKAPGCPSGRFDIKRTCKESGDWCNDWAAINGCLDCSHCDSNDRRNNKCPEC